MKLKISGGIEDRGIQVGNVYDKYGSRNPIVRRLMSGFERSLDSLVQKSGPQTIHEVGCGEGYWTLKWNQRGISARGSDFSEAVIRLARSNARQQKISPDLFQVQSIYDLEKCVDDADLVVCCEVLEHLENPQAALGTLEQVVTRHLLVSVPREPIWSLMNMARAKYLLQLGNTPGHVQRWSCAAFIQLIENYFEVIEVMTPLPWTIALCQARRGG